MTPILSSTTTLPRQVFPIIPEEDYQAVLQYLEKSLMFGACLTAASLRSQYRLRLQMTLTLASGR